MAIQPAEVTEWVSTALAVTPVSQLAAVDFANAGCVSSSECARGLVIRNMMAIETTAVPLDARTPSSVLPALVKVANGNYQLFDSERILNSVKAREEICSTVMGNGVAIPHMRRPQPDAIAEPLIAYGRTFSSVPFGGHQGGKADIFFLILSTHDQAHLQVLARLARLLQLPDLLEELRSADSAQETLNIIETAELKLIELDN